MPLPPRPSSRRRPGLTQAAFRPPPDFDVLTSLPVVRTAAGGVVKLELQYDYGSDFVPLAGWKVDLSDGAYDITAADGRVLTVTLEGGGP